MRALGMNILQMDESCQHFFHEEDSFLTCKGSLASEKITPLTSDR